MSGRSRSRGSVAVLAAFIALTAVAARAQDRIALVIGNDRYPNLPAAMQLQKAANDARAIGDALQRIGFSVIRGENLDRQGMVDRIFEFTRKIKPGDTAVMFYAGHGVAISGGNYLLPSDVRPAGPGEEPRVRNMAIGEADIIADIQERKARTAVLMLDACRDNPFRQPGLTRSVGSDRGLLRGQEASGLFAIYSAGYGQSALDNLGPNDASPNSVFTRVLAPALARTDTHLADIVIDVREEVAKLAATVGHLQSPAYYDQTTGGRVYLAPRTAVLGPALAPVVAPSATPAPAAADPMGRLWQEQESGWTGVWSRRGTSSVFDARWTHPAGGRVAATMEIALDANRITVARRDTDGNPCAYQGTLAAGASVSGTYGCYGNFRSTYTWRATIERGAGADRLGGVWQEEESGWKGVWSRRGTSAIFDANWTHPSGGKVSATLFMVLSDTKLVINRTDYDGNHCIYQGAFAANGTSVNGIYACYGGNTPLAWRATIGN